LLSQSSPPTIYVESFRRGSTHITEEGFDLKLTPENETYRESVKDAQGKDCYEQTIAPLMPGGDDKVTSWNVTLRDLRHTFHRNVLMAEQTPSDEAKNNLFWLNPKPTAPAPLRAKRVMKEEDFYMVDPSEGSALHAAGFALFGSDGISFALTNNDPRTSH
jgi:hypothetical protein